mmetsp:Transcript_12374/g.29078  ORF Transcript_12374/g.29078 Transcript_12374/m.29078 type:complete len:112 (+) Transcript_12374:1148-1483(+)
MQNCCPDVQVDMCHSLNGSLANASSCVPDELDQQHIKLRMQFDLTSKDLAYRGFDVGDPGRATSRSMLSALRTQHGSESSTSNGQEEGKGHPLLPMLCTPAPNHYLCTILF